MNAIIQTWSLFDKLYYHCSRLQFVNQEEQNIFRVRLFTYHGRSFSLSDRTTIHSNDILLRIHLHNCMLMREMRDISNDVKRALYVYNRVNQSLPGLAEYVKNHPNRDEIKGILGITLLTRGVKNLGFDAIDIPNPLYRKIKEAYLVPMFVLCHPEGKWKLMSKKGHLTPKYLAMSKGLLLSKFGSPAYHELKRAK